MEILRIEDPFLPFDPLDNKIARRTLDTGEHNSILGKQRQAKKVLTPCKSLTTAQSIRKGGTQGDFFRKEWLTVYSMQRPDAQWTQLIAFRVAFARIWYLDLICSIVISAKMIKQEYDVYISGLNHN